MSIATETKVGIMVFAAAAGLGWLTYQSGSLGNSRLGDTRSLTTTVATADGIHEGSKVRRAGIDVGQVTDVHLGTDGQAVIVMAVRKDMPLPANITAQITSDGIVGEHYVSLGTDFGPQGQLAGNQEAIPSKPAPTNLNNMMGDFGSVVGDLKSVAASLRSALGGQQNAEKIQAIVNNLNGMSDRLDSILNKEIKPGQIENIVNNVSDFSNGLKGDDAKAMISNIRAASAALNKILSGNQGNISDIITSFKTASDNIAAISTRIENGQGTLGQLLTKDDLMNDMRSAMSDFRDVAHKIDSGEGTVGRLINDDSTVDKLNNALDNFSSLNDRLDSFQTVIEFNGYSLLNEDNIYQGNFLLTLKPRPSRYYVLGVQSDGFSTESNKQRSGSNPYFGQKFGRDVKFTAQFGQNFQNLLWGHDLGLRIGLKNSTFGVGADMNFLDDKLMTQVDLYDLSSLHNGSSPDAPHLDFTAKYMLFGSNLYAMGGINNAFNKYYASPFIGLGFRFADDDLKYMLGKAL